MHKQKFEDHLSSTCQMSSEGRLLDLESEIQGFNTHWGNILLVDFFYSYSKASGANIGIIANFI